MHKNLLLLPLLLCAASALSAAAGSDRIDYRLLATTKTSSMEREMNEAAASGYVFSSLMGGETAFGGKETVVIMSRTSDGGPTRAYKLLATNKTSTMEKELNDQEGTASLTAALPFLNPLSAGEKLPLFWSAYPMLGPGIPGTGHQQDSHDGEGTSRGWCRRVRSSGNVCCQNSFRRQ